MRVLQAMAGAIHGGAEAFFERLAIGFQRAGIDQKVIIRKDNARAERLMAAGVEPVQLSFGGMLDFQTSRQLKKIAIDFKPDVVLTWMNRATKKMPAGKEYKLVARQGGFYDLKYYRHCDYIVGNTHGIVDYLKTEGWPSERAQYLPNFVSIEQFEPVSRSVFSTPDDVPLLLSLGRLHRNKAYDTLIESMPLIQGAYVWIAGEGPEREALKNQARALGVSDRVKFIGWHDDVSGLLAACDVYVCPSRHEPLGNSVIEAWAAERVVVSVRSQGPTELIRHGENGLLTPIDDSKMLAEAIVKVLDDPKQSARLTAAGQTDYLENFTESVVISKYMDFFNRISEQN